MSASFSLYEMNGNVVFVMNGEMANWLAGVLEESEEDAREVGRLLPTEKVEPHEHEFRRQLDQALSAPKDVSHDYAVHRFKNHLMFSLTEESAERLSQRDLGDGFNTDLVEALKQPAPVLGEKPRMLAPGRPRAVAVAPTLSKAG